MQGASKVRLHTSPCAARVVAVPLDELEVDRERSLLAAAFERGREAGVAEVRETTAVLVQKICDDLDAAREHALQQIGRYAVDLSVEIARQLLKIRLEAGDYDLERIVRGALDDSAIGRGQCVVHVSPEDEAKLDGLAFRAGTSIEVDPDLVRGDVTVTTSRGLLVRDLEAVLESIREQLLEDMA